jgi:hypothetical protein
VATALHPLIMMRSDAIKAISGYRHGFEHAQDYDMYMRISQYGRLHNINDVLLKYRYHGNNISTRNLFCQERNAARSELDNMMSLQIKNKLLISKRTFDGYVELRAFRRELGLNIFNYDRALTALIFIMGGAPRSTIRATTRLLAIWVYNNGRYLSKILVHLYALLNRLNTRGRAVTVG